MVATVTEEPGLGVGIAPQCDHGSGFGHTSTGTNSGPGWLEEEIERGLVVAIAGAEGGNRRHTPRDARRTGGHLSAPGGTLRTYVRWHSPRSRPDAPGPFLEGFPASIDVERVSPHDRILVLRAVRHQMSHLRAQAYAVIASVADHMESTEFPDDPARSRMPAARCDLDHRIPWSRRRRTSAAGLDPLCRHDHITVRHRIGWKHRHLPDGDHLWTSVLGHRCTTSGRSP